MAEYLIFCRTCGSPTPNSSTTCDECEAAPYGLRCAVPSRNDRHTEDRVHSRDTGGLTTEVWIAGEANIEGYVGPQPIRVYLEIHPETPPIVKRWERVAFDEPVKQESLGTRLIPKESQIVPTYRPPPHDCHR